MRSISLSEIEKLRKKGQLVSITTSDVKPKPKKKTPETEQISAAIRALAKQKDTTPLIMASLERVAHTLTIAAEKIKETSKQKKIKAWDVVVYRGKDKLIRSLKLSAGE